MKQYIDDMIDSRIEYPFYDLEPNFLRSKYDEEIIDQWSAFYPAAMYTQVLAI